jgi:transposase
VRRAHKFRLRPTARQHVALGQCLASHRELYNAALQERRDAWRLRGTGVSHVEWPKDGDGCRWQPDDVPTRLLAPTRAAVGADVGIASFATTSDGQHVPNPGWGRVAAAKLGTAQQVLARKQRGSSNRRRARATVAARLRKLANQRRNFHHHTARVLIVRHDLVVVEDLRIRNLVRRPAPRPDPDQPGRFLANRAAAKTGLHTVNADEHAARNILRAGLARLATTPAA